MDTAEALVKICPACKEGNPIPEVICRVCITNLTNDTTLSQFKKNASAQKIRVNDTIKTIRYEGDRFNGAFIEKHFFA